MVSHSKWSSSTNIARPMVNIAKTDPDAKDGFIMKSFE